MKELAGTVALGAMGLVIVVAVIFGSIHGFKSFSRYQRVADAKNEIQVTEMRVGIESQKAQIRVEEAHGIAEAQRIIDSSLTNNYLRYLAIQAQMELANSPGNSTVYIPSGEGGIPLVKEVD